MKKFSLFFVLICTINFAQNIESEIWYLKAVQINDGIFERPDDYSAHGESFFLSGSMYSTICISGGIIATYILNSSNQEITFNTLNLYNGECSGDAEGFRTAYFEFMQNNLTDIVNYEFEETTDGLNLKIINSIDDYLLFENTTGEIPNEIVANDWFLYNLTIDGNQYAPPSNEEVSHVQVTFENNGFNTMVCSTLIATSRFDNDHQFYLFDPAQTLIECGPFNGNSEFESRYINFFWNNIQEYFDFEVLTDGENKTLIISDINGNQAIYGNQMMAVSDVVSSQLKIHPNPFTDKLNVLLPENITGNYLFKISDLSGKIIYSKNQNDKSFIWNGSSFPKGVYILSIESNGKTISQKVIKK